MKVLRRHILWLITATIVGIVGAWLFHAAQPHVYRSTAQVDVEPSAALGAPVTPNMATEQQVATSGVILGRTATALGATTHGLAGHLSASVTGTANVLSISCTGATPAAAQRCAAAAAAAYVGFRNMLSQSKTQQARDPLHVTLVTPATLPTALAGPGKKILLPIGAILGLALGAGGIFVRDYFDDRVRDRADLERCLEAPVLAAVPRVRRHTVDPAFVFCRAPRSKAAEAYRYLRSRIKPLIAPVSGSGRVLLVAGPRGLEGRTCVAANLAGALAQAGASVILVDADLRHPSLTETFGAGDKPGLSDLLAGRASLDEVALPAEASGLAEDAGGGVVPARSRGSGARLRFVAAGESAGRTADIFEGANLTGAFTGMKAAADVVVVDSAPVLAVSDAISLARASDLVVMVADVQRTDRGAVRAAVREIRATGPGIIVGVLNNEPSLANRRGPSGSERERESQASSGTGLALPADIVGAGGQNGKRPAQLGAMSTRPYGPTDNGADADDPPGSGSASG